MLKNIIYILCIGLCDWKVHISQVSNNVSQYRNHTACFLQAISNSYLLKNITYCFTVLSSLLLYSPSLTVFFTSFLCNLVSTKFQPFGNMEHSFQICPPISMMKSNLMLHWIMSWSDNGTELSSLKIFRHHFSTFLLSIDDIIFFTWHCKMH